MRLHCETPLELDSLIIEQTLPLVHQDRHAETVEEWHQERLQTWIIHHHVIELLHLPGPGQRILLT